jgi:hypothetical protein
MRKRIVLLSLGIVVTYATYDFYRGGLFSIPDLPHGAYPISFKSGLHAILLDAEVSDSSMADTSKYFRSLTQANKNRKYLGVAFDIQPWFKEMWSWCKAPTQREMSDYKRMPADFRKQFDDTKFEATCRIRVDDKEVASGLIFSVPSQ